MPVSHKYRLVFVHVPKNGGSSIEKALGIYGVGNRGDNREIDESMLFGGGLQHLTLTEILERGDHATRDYFRFTFVRNPWARAISQFKWRKQWDKEIAKMNFSDFVSKELTNTRKYRHYWPQLDFISENSECRIGKLMVDYVGRVESMRNDFGQILAINHLPQLELPHLNQAHEGSGKRLLHPWLQLLKGRQAENRRPAHRNYRQEYDDRSRDLVAEIYCRDVQAFGYEF